MGSNELMQKRCTCPSSVEHPRCSLKSVRSAIRSPMASSRAPRRCPTCCSNGSMSSCASQLQLELQKQLLDECLFFLTRTGSVVNIPFPLLVKVKKHCVHDASHWFDSPYPRSPFHTRPSCLPSPKRFGQVSERVRGHCRYLTRHTTEAEGTSTPSLSTLLVLAGRVPSRKPSRIFPLLDVGLMGDGWNQNLSLSA